MIYADANGTHPLKNSVKEYIAKRINGPFGNPNAVHSIGKNIKNAYENCRKICAEALGADPYQVLFTSGSSEGISQYIKSFKDCSKKKILLSPIEHAAVRNACHYLEKEFQFQIDYLDVSTGGKCSTQFTHDYSIACLMAANNETGVLQPYLEFSKNCVKNNIPFFCDTTQVIGKIDFNFKDSGLDACVISGHKLGSIPGAGILLVKNREKVHSLIEGGGQEFTLRGGTQNYFGVECLTVALKESIAEQSQLSTLKQIKLEFEKELTHKIPEVKILGQEEERLHNTTLLSIPGIHGQALQIELESRNIFVTTSSACADNEPETSIVLKAMKYGDDIGRGVVRISLPNNQMSKNNYSKISNSIQEAYFSLKKIKSF